MCSGDHRLQRWCAQKYETCTQSFSTAKDNLFDIHIFHTDRGSEFDNAVAKSTFSMIKAKFISSSRFDTLDQLQLEPADYVHWFNNARLHSTLGYLSPAEFKRTRTLSFLSDLRLPILFSGEKTLCHMHAKHLVTLLYCHIPQAVLNRDKIDQFPHFSPKCSNPYHSSDNIRPKIHIRCTYATLESLPGKWSVFHKRIARLGIPFWSPTSLFCTYSASHLTR